ncbi:RNA-binding protein NOB1-like [Patiria miniata]|uniref:RNA-binding protein NOB1 n=1 Tax=Patiria miniata TaxID=46514 RepID=A0A914AWW1_PATMI|nr:RNA-binding protein NOB1-like [Patiria miniata]
MAKNMAKHVVVDTVAFFKNIQLQDIAENVYTTQGVVREIKDAATRQRLAVLPYDLKYRDPSPECLQIISDFSKKTGDYRSLSSVDVKVLALTYQLTKEHCGTEHLKLVPEKKVTLTCNTRPLVKATDIVGFYLPPKETTSQTGEDEQSATKETDSSLPKDNKEDGDIELTMSKLAVEAEEEEDGDERTELEAKEDNLEGKGLKDADEINIDIDAPKNCEESKLDSLSSENSNQAQEEAVASESMLEDEEENIDNLSDEDDSNAEAEDAGNHGDGLDGEEGWITPGNISKIRQGTRSDQETADGVIVGCMTADFAMQNVLIHMGIPVLSVEGMLIKTAKSFVLRCRSCFKRTNNMTKVFCPHCGNRTLDKVTVTTEEDGSQRIHLSHRKVMNKRGLKYPLPMPKGGKHADNPVLVEDQPIPHNRLSRKAQMTTDVFNTDFITGNSPFALKDTTSKSAQLGVRSFDSNAAHHRRNPNQVRPKKGRKK